MVIKNGSDPQVRYADLRESRACPHLISRDLLLVTISLRKKRKDHCAELCATVLSCVPLCCDRQRAHVSVPQPRVSVFPAHSSALKAVQLCGSFVFSCGHDQILKGEGGSYMSRDH